MFFCWRILPECYWYLLERVLCIRKWLISVDYNENFISKWCFKNNPFQNSFLEFGHEYCFQVHFTFFIRCRFTFFVVLAEGEMGIQRNYIHQVSHEGQFESSSWYFTKFCTHLKLNFYWYLYVNEAISKFHILPLCRISFIIMLVFCDFLLRTCTAYHYNSVI